MGAGTCRFSRTKENATVNLTGLLIEVVRYFGVSAWIGTKSRKSKRNKLILLLHLLAKDDYLIFVSSWLLFDRPKDYPFVCLEV